jgi:hypothetical protein
MTWEGTPHHAASGPVRFRIVRPALRDCPRLRRDRA